MKTIIKYICIYMNTEKKIRAKTIMTDSLLICHHKLSCWIFSSDALWIWVLNLWKLSQTTNIYHGCCVWAWAQVSTSLLPQLQVRGGTLRVHMCVVCPPTITHSLFRPHLNTNLHAERKQVGWTSFEKGCILFYFILLGRGSFKVKLHLCNTKTTLYFYVI